jgi:hypothetical protein
VAATEAAVEAPRAPRGETLDVAAGAVAVAVDVGAEVDAVLVPGLENRLNPDGAEVVGAADEVAGVGAA